MREREVVVKKKAGRQSSFLRFITMLLRLFQNIMILGDFNADGRYLSKRKKESIRIRSESYHWLISDDVDTTSSNRNDNTYDR